MRTTETLKIHTCRLAKLIALSASLAIFTSPAMSTDTPPPVTAAAFDRGLACVDEEEVKAALYGLHARLDAMVEAGRATPVAMTTMRDGNRPVLDYRPVGSFPLLGRKPLAINWAYGMLPAVTAIFAGSFDELMRPYERAGFEFRCVALGSDGGRSCEAQRPSAGGRLVVAVFAERSVLPAGRVLVACTLVDGNPFR